MLFYPEGEFAGIHNTVGIDGPEQWSFPLLALAESYSREFTAKGKYKYLCTLHPYMKREISVVEANLQLL